MKRARFLLVLVSCFTWGISTLGEGHKAEQGRQSVSAPEQHHDSETDGLRTLSEEIAENFFRLSKPKTGSPPKIDVVFALDASDATTEEGFETQKQLVEKLIDGFSVSLSSTRVAVVSCSLYYDHLNFNFDTFSNKECLYKALQVLRYTHRKRSVGHCLGIINWRVLKTSLGTRKNAKKVVFVIATGKSRAGVRAHIPARKLKRKGVEIFGLGVGPRESDFSELKGAVSSPARRHMFWMKSLDDAGSLGKLLSERGSFSSHCFGNKAHYDECGRRCACIESRLSKCSRVRKDFQSMSKEEKQRFVRVLNRAATEKPYRREFQSLASVYQTYFARGIHDRKFFLPWLRAYLLKLENLLSRIDCRVTVPYWDWTLTSGNPWQTEKTSDLWSSAAYGLGGNGSGASHCVRSGPFRDWEIPSKYGHGRGCLRRAFHGKLPTEEATLFALGIPWGKFSEFELILRVFFFDTVACQIGGDMNSDTAAYTPEFALVSSFVDKLWSEWQNKGDYYRDTGFPHVYLPLPGFKDYSGELQRVDQQPGCVSVAHKEPSRTDMQVDITRLLRVLKKGDLFYGNQFFSRCTQQAMKTFLVTEKEKQMARVLGAFL